eukprot:Em0009g1313a
MVLRCTECGAQVYEYVVLRCTVYVVLRCSESVDLKNPPGAIYRGTPRNEKAGCTLTLSDELFVDMASGKITGQQAFFQGKVKIGGNVMLSQKLQTLFAAQSKL